MTRHEAIVLMRDKGLIFKHSADPYSYKIGCLPDEGVYNLYYRRKTNDRNTWTIEKWTILLTKNYDEGWSVSMPDMYYKY